jgi:diaminopimelate epimerase
MRIEIPFIKGHMGGNEIVLLWGDIPSNKELQIALAALRPPYNLGQDLGLLRKTNRENVLEVNMTWRFDDEYIEMCGGLTQVLGRALVDAPQLAAYLGIQVVEPAFTITLKTMVGLIPITVEIEQGEVKRVLTDMTHYGEQCYRKGIREVHVAGVSGMKVGEHLVMNADKITNKYPTVNLERMDKNTLAILEHFQKEWQKKYPPGDLSFTIYDLHPKDKGQARATFPHNAANNYIESSCGTGTVAAGIAMLEQGEIKTQNGEARISFETGGEPTLGGPDLSDLILKVADNKVVKVEFSHSLIQSLATGKIWFRY